MLNSEFGFGIRFILLAIFDDQFEYSLRMVSWKLEGLKLMSISEIKNQWEITNQQLLRPKLNILIEIIEIF